MIAMKTTRTFKSGNSIAVRLPKALGIEAGVEMRVREDHGKYVLEPVEEKPRKIDVSRFAGKLPWLKPLTPEEREFEDSPREWHLLRKPEE
jgi:antitoxin VapB